MTIIINTNVVFDTGSLDQMGSQCVTVSNSVIPGCSQHCLLTLNLCQLTGLKTQITGDITREVAMKSSTYQPFFITITVTTANAVLLGHRKLGCPTYN